VTTVDMSLELLLGTQLRAFRDAGYDVLTMSAPGPYVAGLEADGIRHVPLRHATRAFSPAADVRALWELYRWFRRLRPDIVHTHNPKPGVYGRIAARLARVPLVVNTQHGLYAQETDPLGKRLACYSIERLAAAFSDVELIQNEEDLATLRRLRVPARKLVLFGNGIDLDRFNPDRFDAADRAWARAELGARSDDDVIVGCVARLTAEKGIPELVEAAELVQRSHPHVRFALIGPKEQDDEAMQRVYERAELLGIRMLGHRHDIDRLYTGMDLFVLPSHREGFPRSVMEAAAMGLPVIGTQIRGMRQAVVDGATGTMVAVNDARAVAVALNRLVADAGTRVAFARAARTLAAERFTVARQVRESLSSYTTASPPLQPAPAQAINPAQRSTMEPAA
jgi:glycosyltransferase involved in cell wall biosynthesis